LLRIYDVQVGDRVWSRNEDIGEESYGASSGPS
jgi:hypothetical protein